MIPKELLNIISTLNSEEWIKSLISSSNVYIVGGSVRDAFLEKNLKDIDLIVEGLSLQQIRDKLLFFGKVDIVGESFSVIKFKPRGFTGEPFDIAIPRVDRKIGTGHKGFEVITEGIDFITDLKRRDFTINSIAVNIKTSKLIDPFNGQKDISNKVLRATDKNAFIEDPLRIVRGIQFASRFKFSIEPETLELMRKNSNLIKEISGERIFEELLKILAKGGSTAIAFDLLNKTGVAEALFNKKIIENIEEFDNLDIISFFYVLGLLGGVDPSSFLKNRLKGDASLEKEVKVLDQLLNDEIITSMFPKNEEDFKLLLFKAFNKAPNVMNATILPNNVEKIVSQMKSKQIPSTMKDIQLTGNDILRISGLKEGPEIGKINNKILRDALMNRFNWKSKTDSIKHLESIL